MDRPTLQRSLVALTAELDTLDRQGRWQGVKAASARSIADEDEQWSDPSSRLSAASHRTVAAVHDGRRETLFSIQARLAVVGAALQQDGAEWTGERAAYRDALDRANVAGQMSAPMPPSADLLAAMRETFVGAQRDRWSAKPLSQWLPTYLEAKSKTLRVSKHLETLRPRIQLFARTIGDLPVRDYEREHFEAYRDVLDRTPARWQARFKTDDPATAIAANEGLRRPFDLMGSKSVDDDYLSPLKTFFTWLADDRHAIERNPGRGIVSTRTDAQARPDEARLPFKPDNLSRFFRYVVGTRPQSSADYWLPLLALYTGARLNELCQVDPGRVIERDGVWLIDLLTVLDRDELAKLPEAERLRLKSAAARREIPVHDDLVKAGFLAFVKSRRNRAGRLFPELKADAYGYYSTAVSKRLNHDIERANAKSPRTTFYSLRHNFRDALTEAEVPERTGDRVMGHVVGGAQGHYGAPHLKPAEVAAIRRISFPGVDLTPYLDPAAVRRPIRRKKVRAVLSAGGE